MAIADPGAESDEEPAFYASAEEMVMRWGQRAGCDCRRTPSPMRLWTWTKTCPAPKPSAFRLESGCAEGINVELWMSEGSGHSPGYGDAFADALLEWLLAQR